jgi:hypothetical protein
LNLETRIARLEAHRDVCNLQGRYNHYLATGQIHDKLPELFAFNTPGVKAEMCDSGMWEGADGVIKLFEHMGTKYRMPGALFVHLLMTPVVEVSKDGARARGMWNSLGTNTYLTSEGKLEAMWQLGKYDNTFVKEDDNWRFLEFKWYVIFRTPYHEGWVNKPIVEGLYQEGFPPVSALHTPYDPGKDNAFLPSPPEPGEL